MINDHTCSDGDNVSGSSMQSVPTLNSFLLLTTTLVHLLFSLCIYIHANLPLETLVFFTLWVILSSLY